MRRSSLIPIVLVLIVVFASGASVFAPGTLHAQEAAAARRAELTRQLNELNTQIAANQAIVDTLAGQGKSLSNEVLTLNATIKKAQAQIAATQVSIRQLDGNIAVHSQVISSLNGKLNAERESLAQILRNTDQLDEYTLPEIALSSESFSDFFADVDTYASIKVWLPIPATRPLQKKVL
jgi:septal ring factor EnvC (AmiA/AmiB activator)